MQGSFEDTTGPEGGATSSVAPRRSPPPCRASSGHAGAAPVPASLPLAPLDPPPRLSASRASIIRLSGLRLSTTRLAASILAASLLAASPASTITASASPAGPSLREPQERARIGLAHPLPPLRLAALTLGGSSKRDLAPARGVASPPDGTGVATTIPGAAARTASDLFAPVLAGGSNVFGSVALGMAGIAAADQWRRVLAEDAGQFFGDGCDASACSAPGWGRWTVVHERAAALSLREAIAFVNREVNRMVRYREDDALYGRRDHWATLTETVGAGAGDCEDYAIAKMWLLEALGVPLSSMQLVALRDERRSLDHAVLAVHLQGQILLLDNVHDRVLADAAVGHYTPMFSFAGRQGFVHGFRRPVERIAAATP